MRRANLFAYFLVLGLAACGGGGGGDSGSGSTGTPAGTPSAGGGGSTGSAGGGAAGGGGGGNGTTGTGTGGSTNTRTPVPDQVALSFTAATTQATVRATTAGRLMSDAGMSARLAQMISSEELALIARTPGLAAGSVTQTIPCTSGSISITGNTPNANGTGSVSVDFVDCVKGTDKLNGPATLTIEQYDSINKIITDSTLTFVRASFTSASAPLNSEISGSQRTVVNGTRASWCTSDGCATEIMTQNLTVLVREGNTSRLMRSRATVTNQYESVTAPTFFTQTISGNVDDDQLGSVSVSTATAPFTGPWGDLYYSTRFQPYPDWGIIRINGATNSAARSSSMGIALAKVEVDTDGDGVFENNARLRWIDMATAAGSDLRDSDADGMHDSWEVAHGLNASVNDANADNDGDGWSNYAEYLVGADPSTNGSVPADVRHLWVTGLRDIGVDATTPNTIDVFFGSSGSGTTLNTVTRELSATTFTGFTEPNGQTNRTVTDAQGRTCTLAPTASDTVWTLSCTIGTSTTSITVDNVGGTNPGSLIRYGDRGIAFRTTGSAPSSSSAAGGYVYLIESRTLIP
jgi:hypothetical protein